MMVLPYRMVLAGGRDRGRHLRPHQKDGVHALLHWWTNSVHNPVRGTLYVGPTASGKTTVGSAFCLQGPLAAGHKVLWLAESHHLLNQAFDTFGSDLMSENVGAGKFRLRVVSGSKNHLAPCTIKAEDDIVFMTLQTLRRDLGRPMPFLNAFLSGAQLTVVFDEAHHAPAPSYRRAIRKLQMGGAAVLGLTATPSHSTGEQLLPAIFPQGVCARASALELVRARVLAKPEIFRVPTQFSPVALIDSTRLMENLSEGHDLPENVVEHLARNAPRNALIAETYARQRRKFGKTVIFADRTSQCEALVAALRARRVKADSMYNRAGRAGDEHNDRVLEDFRNGRIEVLVNIRMMTEGVDVPDIQTVFMTRQTTSKIAMVQMAGRALRGPKAGGTETANIVIFVDAWPREFDLWWADSQYLGEGDVEEAIAAKKANKNVGVLQGLPAEAVRAVAKELIAGVHVGPGGALVGQMPVGWYETHFEVPGETADEYEPRQVPIVVTSHQKDDFDRLIDHMLDLRGRKSLKLDAGEVYIKRYFSHLSRTSQPSVVQVVCIIRHILLCGTRPRFHAFDALSHPDVEHLCAEHVACGWSPKRIDHALRREFTAEDRLWGLAFDDYDAFRTHYDASNRRLLRAREACQKAFAGVECG